MPSRQSRGKRQVPSRKPTPSSGNDSHTFSSILFLGYLVLLAFEWLGLQQEIPLLKAIRFTTLLGYGLLIGVLTQGGVSDIFRRPQGKIFIALIAFSAVSMAWAVVSIHAFNSIRPLVDYTVFFVLTAALVNSRARIVKLAWTLTFICTTLVVWNGEKLGSSVRAGGFRAGYFLGDGNDLAWGMTIALPIICYLLFVQRNLWSRLVGLTGVGACLLAIVGSTSRGGTLALGASLLYYLIYVSRRKLQGVLTLAVAVLGILLLAPGGYFDRMKTIGAYQQDSSAQSRIMLWRASFEMALDYPLGVGAGNFASAYGRYYKPGADRGTEASSVVWGQGRWLNAHSIYFKTLGEYGFLGFFLIAGLVLANLRSSVMMRDQLLRMPEPTRISADWPALVGMSVSAFAVGGIFLGGLAYPHMFFLSGLVVANSRSMQTLRSEIPVSAFVGTRKRQPGSRCG